MLWREWIDLRMYCTGRALDAAESGARIVARYRAPLRRRDDLAAYAGGATPIRALETAAFTLRARSTGAPAVASPPITVGLGDTTVGDGGAVRWSVRVRGHAEPRYIYLRSELFRFDVRGPLGSATCSMARSNAAPIRDLFRRFGRGAQRAFVLEARSFCRDAFRVEGVYEVTPTVDLAIDGRSFELDAWSGTFHGPPAIVRVTRGLRDAYLEQTVNSAPRGEP